MDLSRSYQSRQRIDHPSTPVDRISVTENEQSRDRIGSSVGRSRSSFRKTIPYSLVSPRRRMWKRSERWREKGKLGKQGETNYAMEKIGTLRTLLLLTVTANR